MAHRRFLLLSTPRAGTHMIRSAIDQHPEISCYGEMFNAKRDQWYPECTGLTNQQVESWMLARSDKRRVGFALHICNECNPVSQRYWETTDIDERLPIIYVFRRNPIRQTLSLYRSQSVRAAAGDGGYMSYRTNTSGHDRFGWTVEALKTLGKIKVDCDDFHERMVSREAHEITFFAQRRLTRICAVAYEDFVDDPVAETRRITSFLDVGEHYAAPQTQKTGGRAMSAMIDNFQEFNEYFRSTPYSKWLSHEN